MLASNPDPFHARIDFEMDFRLLAGSLGHRRNLTGDLKRRYRYLEVLVQEILYLASKDSAKDQDRHPDPLLAKLDSFFEESDPQIIDSEFAQCLRDTNHAVTIAVRFDNSHDFDARSNALSDTVKVVAQFFQVDIGPGQSHAGPASRLLSVAVHRLCRATKNLPCRAENLIISPYRPLAADCVRAQGRFGYGQDPFLFSL